MRTRKSPGAAIIATLIGPDIPGGYMAITGHAYTWARVWYGALMVIGLLILVARNARND